MVSEVSEVVRVNVVFAAGSRVVALISGIIPGELNDGGDGRCICAVDVYDDVAFVDGIVTEIAEGPGSGVIPTWLPVVVTTTGVVVVSVNTLVAD